MKSVSAGLQAVIDDGDVQWTFIWKLKRRDGIIYAYTEHDQPLRVDLLDGDGLVTYQPGTISEPSEPDQSLGVKVDNADLTGATGLIDGFGINKDDIVAGRFDGAEITTAHCHWPDPGLGGMIASVHFAGDAVDREQTFSISSRSLVSRFDARPTIKIEPECRHEFGSPECGYSLTGQIHTGAITAQTDARRYVSDVIQAADYFSFGVLEFTTGRNAGIKYDINTSGAAGEIELSGPPRLPVSIGDNVSITLTAGEWVYVCLERQVVGGDISMYHGPNRVYQGSGSLWPFHSEGSKMRLGGLYSQGFGYFGMWSGRIGWCAISDIARHNGAATITVPTDLYIT